MLFLIKYLNSKKNILLKIPFKKLIDINNFRKYCSKKKKNQNLF